MNTFIAFLRGINVGGNNKVDMKMLKTTFESIGYTKVSTYINSGNIIFSSATKPNIALIEQSICKDFSIKVPVIIRSAESLVKLNTKLPKDWHNNTKQKTDILFLQKEYCSPSTIALIKHDPEIDDLRYVNGAIIWHLNRSLYSKSSMNKFIGTPVYKNMTARNINTVRKLVELLK